MAKVSSSDIVFLLVAVTATMFVFLLLGFQMGRFIEREADGNGGVETLDDATGLHAWQPRGVVSAGPWGGAGGQPFFMRGGSAPRLRGIVLYHSDAVGHSLACHYTLTGELQLPPFRVAGPWGRPRFNGSMGARSCGAEIELHSGEYITEVEGATGHSGNVSGVVITSLTFRTSSGRTYGPYGGSAAGSHKFSVPAAQGACIVGFWGRSGSLLDAVGVYVKPSCFM